MKRNEIIALRLSEVLLDGAWIANTNFKSQITTCTYAQATLKVGNLNTISALTYHINYYLEGILKLLEGEPLTITDSQSYTMQALTSQNEWEQLVKQFLYNAVAFIKCVHSVDEALLDTVFVHPDYGTYERNLEGMIEHCYYHLGQVVLIKKLIDSQS